MEAGQLRHYVTVQTKTTFGTGTRGQPDFQWTNLYNDVPASIETLNGRKLELSRQLVATASHKITFRYLPNLTVKDRIVWDSKVYNIGHIDNPDQRNRWLVLTVTEERA